MDSISLILTGLLALGFGWLCYLFFGKATDKGTNRPPGPPGSLPIFGHLFQMEQGKPVSATMGKWAAKYGPIFGVWLGSNYTVVLNEPKLIRTTMNNPNLSGRPNNKVFKAIAGGNYGLLFSYDQTWTEQRRFTLRHLREFGFGKNVMETLILDEARDLVDGFKPDVGRSISGLGRRFSLAVLSSLWFIVSGERLSHDDQEMKSILEDVFKQCDRVLSKGMTSVIPQIATIAPERSGYNGLVRAMTRVSEYLRTYVVQHEETAVEGQPRDFIDSYLDEMRSAKEGSSFWRENGYKNLLAIITDLFGAGAETTSTTLDWAVLYLATRPAIQKELQSEIDAVIGRERLPSLADKASMPFTEAVMMEVMRYSSIAGHGLPHTTLDDMQIAGYDVPKGSFVFPNLKYVHFDPATWDKPQEFDPTRFLSADRKTCVKNEALMPFSTGKRVCIGEKLAGDVFFLFLACIFQKYTIQLDSAMPPPIEGEPLNTFILKPQPYHVIMQERNANQ